MLGCWTVDGLCGVLGSCGGAEGRVVLGRGGGQDAVHLCGGSVLGIVVPRGAGVGCVALHGPTPTGKGHAGSTGLGRPVCV